MMYRMEATTDTRSAAPRPILARLARIALWVGGIALVLFILNLLGVPVADWIRQLFKEIRAVPPAAIVGGFALEVLQTTLSAITWLTILRAAFPDAHLPFRPVLAAYSVSVALNAFLPANIGTLVMMIMLVTLIEGSTFAAIFSGFVIQKIPYTVLSVAVYLYLFLTVPGSFSQEFDFLADSPALSVAIAIATVVLLVFLARYFWRRAAKLRDQLKTGGAILGQPRRFLIGVGLPAVASFTARLGITGVFLAAFSIPVTFHTVMAVTGANSLSSSVSVTPGGVGVTQALNVVVLESVTSSSNATAYSLAQQLIIAASDVVIALVLVAWVFGWSGGKDLVRKSYADAEVKARELKEQRDAKRAAGGKHGRLDL
jgi:uncharacterized membrane protein YbhN (UPF0104 family)